MNQPRNPISPCATCPYRKDAPLRYWHRSEFARLLASERDPIGTVYACHGHKRVDPRARGICAGWLLDQKRRDVPSIALRLMLRRDDILKAFEAVHAGGARLYRTVASMCRANGVRAPVTPLKAR